MEPQPGYSQGLFNTASTVISMGDYGAAMAAWEFIEMQRAGVKRGVYFKSAWIPSAAGDFPCGPFSDQAPWSVGNVFRMWELMGAASVVTQELVGDPGLHAMAAKNTVTGRLFVLVASAHFKRSDLFAVTVALPGVASGRVTTLHVIDREHSNQYEAGLGKAALQTVAVADVASEQVRLTMQARSVCLPEIAP